MGRNKKPRRPYHERPIGSFVMFLDQWEIDMLKGLFTDTAFAVESKLHRGTMTLDDVQMLRDYVNLCTALSITGHLIDHDFFEDNTRRQWQRLQQGFHTFYQRCIHEKCFTCTAEELDAIREGIVIADRIFQLEMFGDDEVKGEPIWVYSNLLYVKYITDVPNTKTVSLDLTRLEQEILRVRQGPYRRQLKAIYQARLGRRKNV